MVILPFQYTFPAVCVMMNNAAGVLLWFCRMSRSGIEGYYINGLNVLRRFRVEGIFVNIYWSVCRAYMYTIRIFLFYGILNRGRIHHRISRISEHENTILL